MAAKDDKVMLSLQVPGALLDDLDRIAAAAQLSRSDVARRALTLNLGAVERSLGVTGAETQCRACPIHCEHKEVQLS